MARNPQPRRNERSGNNQPRRIPNRGGPPGRRPLSPPRGPRNNSRNGQDSWRPNNDGPRYSDGGRPPRGNDQYVPPQGDFTFRMDKPAGMGESGPGFRSDRRGPRRSGPDRKRQDRRSDRPRWRPPPHLSERQLLSADLVNVPEERLLSGDAKNKFRNLDEMSDDEELGMDISPRTSDDEQEGNEPAAKRVKADEADEAKEQAPKWSNPDPYTALPCPEETTGKKRDVVKLIRKARVEESSESKAAPGTAEDFISFDTTEDEDDQDDDDDEDDSDETSDEEDSEEEYEPSPAIAPQSQPPLPPGPPPTIPPPPREPPPPPPPTGPAADRSGPLGSRKRTIDDEIKPPDYGQFKQATTRAPKGGILGAWLSKAGEDPCPWSVNHDDTKDMAFRLHKEVIDFYEYVRPRAFEQRIRDNLVDNLKKAMRRDARNFGSAQIFPFGSFMSGLYLPTADMDMVVCSASFMRGGPPTYLSAKSWLYKFQKFLVSQQIADHESITVIAHARIPLVKFVDKLTGLKVDVSFENMGGVDAIDTFLNWKQLYPSMPILVTVIKHFLLMRGLNEPVNGGLGGFSVICLVVSMLQLMPQVQSRSMIPEHHLGEMLLEFLELYGRHFRFEVNAISLTSPPGYIRKTEVSSFGYKNKDRMSIIDPNNSSNDISGGSSNTTAILGRFQEAYNALRDRMDQVARDPKAGGILDVIMKGDYSSFRLQRDFLRRIHERTIGPCSD